MIIMLSKLSLSQSKIFFRQVTCTSCKFVYHTYHSAITIEGAIFLNSTVTIKSLLWFFLNNFFVMLFDYLWRGFSTAIAYFNGVLLRILCNLLEQWKWFSVKFTNIFATLIDTSKFISGLNQMILRCPFCLTFFCSRLRRGYFSYVVCPHFFSVSSCYNLVFPNISALNEFRDNLSLIICVSYFFFICG